MSSSIDLNPIYAKKTHIIAEAQQLLNDGKAQSEEYRQMVSEIDTLQLLIDATTRAGMDKSPAESTTIFAAPAVISLRDSAENRGKVDQAARTFFRHGASGLNAEERSLLATSDASGGAVISQSFDQVFIEAAKFSGNIFDLVHRKDASIVHPTKFVVSDGTNQTFSLLTEGTTSAVSRAQQPTVFSDITNTDTLISSVVYGVQELDDAFSLESFLTRLASTAVLRAWETAITVGTTNDAAATALPNSPTGGLLASVSAGVTQNAGTLAAGPSYEQLSALAGSVDRSYYQDGAFMASPSVETLLRSQVDSTGRPLYPIDPATGFLVIAGRPLCPNAAMPAAGTPSSPLVLFGDYSRAWNVLNGGVRLKVIANDESPALSFLTRELIVWTRLGQSAGLSNAVKSLVSAAS